MSETRVSAPSRQDHLLMQLQQASVPVSIYLQNGVKLQGCITEFDAHVIILRGSVGSQMVFKHAILTIVPSS